MGLGRSRRKVLALQQQRHMRLVQEIHCIGIICFLLRRTKVFLFVRLLEAIMVDGSLKMTTCQTLNYNMAQINYTPISLWASSISTHPANLINKSIQWRLLLQLAHRRQDLRLLKLLKRLLERIPRILISVPTHLPRLTHTNHTAIVPSQYERQE